MKSGIYIFVWSEKNYFYVGQTQNFTKRKHSHMAKLRCGKHNNKFFQNVFNKHGEPSFHILEECEIEELSKREQFYLDILFESVFCLNVLNKVESARRGVLHSKESIEKMSKIKLGKKHSKETCEKMSKNKSGSKNHFFKKKHSKESIEKMSQIKNKKLVQLDKNGNFIREWKSGFEVEKCLKINNGHISSCANGKRKSAGGFMWKIST